MAELRAEVRMRTGEGEKYIGMLCESFAKDELEVAVEGGRGRVFLPRGRGVGYLEASEEELLVRAEAATEQGLSALKFMLGLRLERAAAEEARDLAWTGDGCDLEVLPNFREMRVRRVVDVSPSVRRITLAGEDLARFDGDALHIRMLFPPKGLEAPEWPVPGRNGRPVWPPEERRPATRVYTIRRVDVGAGEFDVDFVMHGDHGIASSWAAAATAGDVVGVLGPGGSEFETADWILLAGDETAIPAIARILERQPEHVRGTVLIEVADARDVQRLWQPAGVAVKWLFRDGVEAGRSQVLADAVLAQKPPEEGSHFCWLGAEAATARKVREHWRKNLRLAKSQHLAVAYWRHEDTAPEQN